MTEREFVKEEEAEFGGGTCSLIGTESLIVCLEDHWVRLPDHAGGGQKGKQTFKPVTLPQLTRSDTLM